MAQDPPSTSQPSPSRGGIKPLNNTSSITAVATPVFQRLCSENKTLQASQVPQFLEETGIRPPGGVDPGGWAQDAVAAVAGPRVKELSYDECMAIVGILQSPLGANPSQVSLVSSPSTTAAGVAKAPLKALTKNRGYLYTGSLAYDEAVLSYLQKLDEHRRKCESDGRYAEARAAALRLADLRTAQVERLRQELVANQARELEEVHRVYEEETAKFVRVWERRVKEYEANFARGVEDLKAAHEDARIKYAEELEGKRPTRPKLSRDYLNHKKIEESLAKTQQYIRAKHVKAAAEELYAADMEATHASFEAEQRLRLAKFTARQQQEFEALLQRGARGRDELELRRVSEMERRTLRFRNIVSELENLHKLEVVQLENFLDAQVAAGKAVPLKDEGAFRRRREQLYSTQF